MKTLTLLTIATSLLSQIASADLPKEVNFNGIHLRGSYFLDKRTNLARFNMRLENSVLRYRIAGQTLAQNQLSLVSEANIDFDTVRITKEFTRHPEVQEQISNTGRLVVFPFERHAQNMTLAGSPVSGMYENGAVDLGIDFNQLQVNHRQSIGTLDYDSVNGYLNPEGAMYFGPYQMRAANNSSFLMNLDDALGQKIFWTSMIFGNLNVRGQIQYNDVEVSHTEIDCHTDSDGDRHCDTRTVTEMVATTGNIHWYVSRNDGTPLNLAAPHQQKTQDDLNIQALIAWLELMAYDLR